MFEWRARAGQCFQRPCLGAREFAADFRLLEEHEADPPVEGAMTTESPGWIFYDFDRSERPPRPRFFEARLEAERMLVPPPDSVGLRS